MNNKSAVDYSDEFNQFLSFVDLERDPEWNPAWKAQNKSKVEELLYKYGADIRYGFGVEVCTHRPRTSNAIEHGPKIVFKERSDKEWLPFMSTEDMIANTKDSFLRSELMTISQQSNFSGSLIDQYGEEGDDV